MKYLIPMILASSMLMAEQSCLSLRDLGPQHMEQMQQGTLNCVLEVREGDELPLKFDLSGDTLAFKTPPESGTLVALRTFYILVEGEEMYLSLDKENWTPPWEFFTGSISAGVGTKVEPFGTIGLHADVR
ncbi:hypothetical protein [Simkania sp.]|uniref:hypothetical protein n=1 Tax=Simkania sp. TaxID=34094 RepID=UPI003B51B986